MTTVRDIYSLMDEKAPFYIQESWDNSGMLAGRWDAEVKHIFLTLDITPETIQEAAALGCDLIISHHPVIFGKISAVREDDYTGKRVLMLIENHIAAICCHTSLDCAFGGVNDILAEKCGIAGDTEVLEVVGKTTEGIPYGVGRVGALEETMELDAYLEHLKKSLAPNGMRYYNAKRPVKRVAVGGGSCGSMLEEAVRLGCDTFVTADLKYDHFLAAKEYSVNLIDAGHFPTENPVMDTVAEWLTEAFPAVKVTKSALHHEVISYT